MSLICSAPSFTKHAQRTAYEDECDQLSFDELQSLVLGGVRLLRDADISAGDRVAILPS